jgi:hypothetical protein
MKNWQTKTHQYSVVDQGKEEFIPKSTESNGRDIASKLVWIVAVWAAHQSNVWTVP